MSVFKRILKSIYCRGTVVFSDQCLFKKASFVGLPVLGLLIFLYNNKIQQYSIMQKLKWLKHTYVCTYDGIYMYMDAIFFDIFYNYRNRLVLKNINQ